MHFWEPLYDITLPPGTQCQILPHPHITGDMCEIGIVESHRFAFYFWSHWGKSGAGLPDLVSIDWHKDLAPPSEKEKEDLNHLSLDNRNEIALFCWSRMNPYNDGHILSAAWLDLIGDIYVLCKQKFQTPEVFISRNGRQHHIFTFREANVLGRALAKRKGHLTNTASPTQNLPVQTIFDIDLDYFTESEEFRGGGSLLTTDNEEDIGELLKPASTWMQLILQTLAGMTIATEPGFCGGYLNAFKLLSVVSDVLFYPPLLHDGCRWKTGI